MVFIKTPCVMVEFAKHFKERQKIVKLIESGEIIPGEEGYTELPVEYKLLSRFGKVMAHKRGKELSVLFDVPTMRNGQFELIYSSENDAPMIEEYGVVSYGLKTNKISEMNGPGEVLPVHRLLMHWFFYEIRTDEPQKSK